MALIEERIASNFWINKKTSQHLTCTPKVRQKTFGVLLCLKSTGNMAMQND